MCRLTELLLIRTKANDSRISAYSLCREITRGVEQLSKLQLERDTIAWNTTFCKELITALRRYMNPTKRYASRDNSASVYIYIQEAQLVLG